jgi:hypothetical protein
MPAVEPVALVATPGAAGSLVLAVWIARGTIALCLLATPALAKRHSHGGKTS